MTKALRTLREEVETYSSHEVMKTEIYKIKTDQAWNRLYNRLTMTVYLRKLMKAVLYANIHNGSDTEQLPPF